MPVIEVKLYDRRVTEESVPKMIEALTSALHETSGAAVEDINVIIQGVAPEHWGKGGKSPLVCFDCGFGSTHGIVFAGSGGYKTTSVVVPTALKFKGSMIVLDPSTEIAPMVTAHREAHGQDVLILDPKRPDIGFNVLDWIGRFGNAPEEDIASVAAWLTVPVSRPVTASFLKSSFELLAGRTEPAQKNSNCFMSFEISSSAANG